MARCGACARRIWRKPPSSTPGFSVARNAPYAGGYTTLLHGRPSDGVHALQIEINRRLYLDEERIERGPRFDDVRMPAEPGAR